MANLVQRVEPVATRQDLVLGKQQLRVMDQIALQWRAQTLDGVNGARAPKAGHAISALFAGASGTGKTMAGEILATETRLAFYRVDLGHVVSQYLGETESNLAALFDTAQEAGALLFLDEAEALFGRRNHVADAHDRYANLEVDCLLRHIEDFRGIVILATNMKRAIDPAFLPRVGYVIEFPLPDMAQRAEIWQRIFPPDTPVEGLDPTRLARLPLSGANIRDIARASADLAAIEGQPVRMSHLLRAAQSECAKFERPVDVGQIARP